MKRYLSSLFILILLISNVALLADDNEKEQIVIDEYLLLGPIMQSVPAFVDGVDENYDNKELLLYNELDVENLWPKANDEINISSSKKLKWTKLANSSFESKSKSLATYYLAAYINVDRYLEGELKLSSSDLMSFYIDGNKIASKTDLEKDEATSGKIKLENGKHVLIIKLLNDPSKNTEIKIESVFEFEKPYEKSNVAVSISPKKFTGIKELLDNKKVKGVSLSYNAKYSAVKVSRRNKSKSADETWIEIYKNNTKKLFRTYRGGNKINDVDWSPVNETFAYSTNNSGKTNIWIADINTSEVSLLVEDISDFTGFSWSPKGNSIFYSTNISHEIKDKNFKKYHKIEDRWPYGNDKSYIYQINLHNGITRRITAGDKSTSLVDVSHDETKLIYSHTEYNHTTAPFFRIKYFLVNLQTLKQEELFKVKYIGDAKFSPKGKKLLLHGSSSEFDNLGKTIPNDVYPNDFDTQAYIYDLETKDVVAISKKFDPSINRSYWIDENTIYFLVTDKAYTNVYEYNVQSNSYKKLELGVEKVDEIYFSKTGDIALYRGSSSNVPDKVYLYNVEGKSHTLLTFPDTEIYSNISLGEVKDWDFTSSENRTVYGRVYYPPNFDNSQKYPAIVYYYGGTSPVGRGFEGRYPFNIWTAQGYIVYVLQPTGAFGFGQENSAVHANDWGKVTAQEIIEGTKKFVKDHPFVDGKKLGCMGASYGGFLTMNLITKTDLFAASISHAGISTLTSYWGEGYWGPWYNGVAAAKGFPWNSKDIYVDHSPIYNADKITTPLLLLHGNIDPNVPRGESWTMYAALKILDKDVEMIEIDGQGHWIMQYDKRKKWSKIILSYFDKYLKDQPEWWKELTN